MDVARCLGVDSIGHHGADCFAVPGEWSTRSNEHAAGTTAARQQARPFVGRARELDDLGLALEDAASGHGSLLMISGEPGIGKSRLMEEVAARAEGLGWRVLTGRCWEGGGARVLAVDPGGPGGRRGVRPSHAGVGGIG
jgi:hypothetical protein